MSPSDSARIHSCSVVVALAVLLCALSLHPMVLFVTHAYQILNRNSYYIVSSTAVVKINGMLNRVSNSGTPYVASAGLSRISHFRHYRFVLGHVQWAKSERDTRILVL